MNTEKHRSIIHIIRPLSLFFDSIWRSYFFPSASLAPSFPFEFLLENCSFLSNCVANEAKKLLSVFSLFYVFWSNEGKNSRKCWEIMFVLFKGTTSLPFIFPSFFLYFPIFVLSFSRCAPYFFSAAVEEELGKNWQK